MRRKVNGDGQLAGVANFNNRRRFRAFETSLDFGTEADSDEALLPVGARCCSNQRKHNHMATWETGRSCSRSSVACTLRSPWNHLFTTLSQRRLANESRLIPWC